MQHDWPLPQETAPRGFITAAWRGTTISPRTGDVGVSFNLGDGSVVRLLLKPKCVAALRETLGMKSHLTPTSKVLFLRGRTDPGSMRLVAPETLVIEEADCPSAIFDVGQEKVPQRDGLLMREVEGKPAEPIVPKSEVDAAACPHFDIG